MRNKKTAVKNNGKIFLNGKKTRFVTIFVVFGIITSLLSGTLVIESSAFAPDFQAESDAVYMMNLDTNIEAYKKNELKQEWPASTTKIMTCLLTLELVPNLDDTVRVTYDATNEFWEGDPNKANPSNAALEPGQEGLTYRDVLYALMIASACEGANILAINIAGDIPTFVEMMNRRAAALGCVNTHFGNAHGLFQEDNFSCAYDMYLITRYAYENYPLFAEIIKTTEYPFPANSANPGGYIKRTTNKLLQNTADNAFYYEYAFGVKTGSIGDIYDANTQSWTEGVACLVSIAQKGGFTYLVVTLNAPYHDNKGDFGGKSFNDHIRLYKWAFSTLTYQMVLSENDIISSVKVAQGENADQVQLRPEYDYATLLPNNLDKTTIQKVITKFEDEIVAPVAKGAPLGRVELRLENETLAIIDLVAVYPVERSQAAAVTEKVKDVLDKAWFKASVAALIFLIILVATLNTISRVRKQRRDARKRQRGQPPAKFQ